MSRIFLSIGSNIEPQKNIPACFKALRKEFYLKKISSVYETVPEGPAGNQNFWNAAAEIETELDLESLTKKLRRIEDQLGRKRDSQNKFAPRTIDLDILPQEDYQKRAFIMIPLAEIAPEERDLETGKSFRELAENLKKHTVFKKIPSAL